MYNPGTLEAKATGLIARLIGQFGSSGPTGSNWLAGDVAPDSTGSLWVCTQGYPSTVKWQRLGKSMAFDIRDFGAVCDGTTDDTAAVAAAIAAAQAVSTPLIKFQNGSGTFQGGSATSGAGVVWVPGITLVSNVIGGHRVHIAGAGWGTGFYQKASSTGPVYTNRRDGSVHAKYTGLQNLAIIGNKANQSSANHGVHLRGDNYNGTDGTNFVSTFDEDYDEAHHLTNVYIWGCKGDGLRMEGSGANQVLGLKVRSCDGNGIYTFQDNEINNADVGWSGLRGVYVEGDSCRLNNIKSWYSGQVTPASGQGFYITADCGIANDLCAQDNTAQGLLFDGANNWVMSGEADSNSKGSAGTYAQIDVYNSSNIRFTGNPHNRYSVTVPHPGPGTVVLNMAGGSLYNKIDLTASIGIWGNQTLVKSGSTLSGNEVHFGAVDGWQDLAYASTITPDILKGSNIRIGALTGNITIANPTWSYDGAPLRLRFKEDGTGLRTVTFGSAFDSGITVVTTANSVTTINLRYSSASSKWELW